MFGNWKNKIMMNGVEAGSVKISGEQDVFQLVTAAIQMEKGEYELTLKFTEADCLEIMKIVLW